MVFDDNSGIISRTNVCCRYSLGDSSECPRVFMENYVFMENCVFCGELCFYGELCFCGELCPKLSFIIKYPLYLLHCGDQPMVRAPQVPLFTMSTQAI